MLIIGADSTPLGNPYSGGGRYAMNILKKIASKNGVQLRFYGRAPAPEVLNFFPGVPVFEQNTGITKWYGQVLPKLLQQNRCDSYWGFPLPLRKIPGIKYVTSILDVYPFYLHNVEQWPWTRRVRTIRQRFLARWVTARTVQVADKIIVISRATARDLEKYFHVTDFLIAPPAPDIVPEVATDKSNPVKAPYILAVGGYQPYRNRKRLIQAFAAAKAAEFGYLVIVGRFQSPQQRWEYSILCERYGVSKRVLFASDIGDSQLADLYARSEGVIHPSLCEGFGIPVVEALAFGKPIAISNVGPIPEAAGGFEIAQFDPMSVEQMAGAITALFSDRNEAVEIKEARQAYAKKFTWQTAAAITWGALTQR